MFRTASRFAFGVFAAAASVIQAQGILDNTSFTTYGDGYGPGVGGSTAELHSGQLSLTVPAPGALAPLCLGLAFRRGRR